jgi:integrase
MPEVTDSERGKPFTREQDKAVLEKASAERLAPMLPGKKRTRSREQNLDNVLPLHADYYPDPQFSGGPGKFAEVLKEAKLDGKGYTFHSWRHTFRTRLSEAGVSDDLAKRLGGWTENATAARYDHAERVEELREAVEKAHNPGKEKATQKAV